VRTTNGTPLYPVIQPPAISEATADEMERQVGASAMGYQWGATGFWASFVTRAEAKQFRAWAESQGLSCYSNQVARRGYWWVDVFARRGNQ